MEELLCNPTKGYSNKCKDIRQQACAKKPTSTSSVNSQTELLHEQHFLTDRKLIQTIKNLCILHKVIPNMNLLLQYVTHIPRLGDFYRPSAGQGLAEVGVQFFGNIFTELHCNSCSICAGMLDWNNTVSSKTVSFKYGPQYFLNELRISILAKVDFYSSHQCCQKYKGIELHILLSSFQ